MPGHSARTIASTLAISLTTMAICHGGSAHAADGTPADATLLAHHVRLKGTIGDQSEARDRVLTLHNICVTAHTISKRPIKSAAPPELPREVTTVQFDMYYADQRVTQEARHEGYDVDDKDCSVGLRVRRFREIFSMTGACKIDLINNEARGFCGGPMPIAPRAAAEVLPPGKSPGSLLQPTGETRTIAGQACQVHRTDVVHHLEVCIARPDSPFPLLASSFNIGQPGLVLSIDSKPSSVNVEATMVTLAQRVPADLFRVPEGAKINPGASKR